MSNQNVRTPRVFLDAIERRFGPITFDLAANRTNHVAPKWFGPGGVRPDALKASWKQYGRGGISLLNPPFEYIREFAQKTAYEHSFARLQPTAFIGPAAVCTGWFRDFIVPNAYVFEVHPRVFKDAIRDVILALFTPDRYLGRESWQWK